MDVSSWLRDLGLEDYVQAFQANHIDAKVLPRLTADDLTALGITSVGHRRTLLDAIAALDVGRPTAAAEPIAVTTRPGQAERRQLTVLFCDLVGSTELAARLDPEDLRGIMAAYQRCAAAVVERFEGHIAKYLGDGVLAYFGWPQAHEDDAERAVRAGLQLVEAITRLEPDAAVRLQARIGIATGRVVVGDLVGEGASREEAVVGDVPNLAARLQALAEPGMVVIGEATHRLLGGLFQVDDLGPQQLKGFAEPLAVWRVSGESSAEGRFEARYGAGLTPLVGREEEIALLLRRWEYARDGEGQVVLLSGEPGIGKSRIVREVRARLEGEPHVRLLYQCSPHHTTSPLHPLIEQLERAACFARDDPPAARLDKLEGLLARRRNKLNEVVPLIAALLGLPIEDRYPPLDLTPQRQKQRMLEVLVDQLEGLAAAQPVLVTYEDVHWIDPTTQELLGLAIERIQHLPVLAIVTFRPDFTPSWSGQPHVSVLALTRLGRRDGAALVDRVVGNKALPAEVSAQIVAKTDGVPLFVEELTKTVLESGLLRDAGNRYELAGPLPPLAIPSTLHDSLLARLDRLAPVKEVAQIGAAIGREFSHALLAAVADRPEPELQAALDQLVAAELVFCRGTPPDATYSFKHALVQEAAYSTLLKSRRQHLHARIAQVLEEEFPEQAEAQPELLAHHCGEGGLIAAAVTYWYQAGKAALIRSAVTEAVAQLSNGLELLHALPDGHERYRHELDLRVALGGALLNARGWAAPEAGEAYERALELCQLIGERKQVFPVLWGLTVVYVNRAELPAAREVAGEMLRLAEEQDDPVIQVAAHRANSAALYHLGDLVAARDHLERILAVYDSLRDRLPPTLYAADFRVQALCFLSATLLGLGYPDQARALGRNALLYAKELAHSQSIGLALSNACQFFGLARDMEALDAHAEELACLGTAQGFPQYLNSGVLYRGCVLAQRGHLPEGLALYMQGLVASRRAGKEREVPLASALLAEAYLKADQAAEGLGVLEEPLGRIPRTGEGWMEAELHRVRGDLLMALPQRDPGGAEACFHRAIAVACQQSGKMWELRAAISLARLWAQEGKRQNAYELLAPVYGWFTEGFDTADLKDAKALLDELA
jgi:class 3 adenylate cyclase/predicted ATPase